MQWAECEDVIDSFDQVKAPYLLNYLISVVFVKDLEDWINNELLKLCTQ